MGFWDELTQNSYSPLGNSIDRLFSSRSKGATSSVRKRTDSGRAEFALPLPVASGTRVAFVDNLGSILGYADPPVGQTGTVVTVRTAAGDDTSVDGMVFVKWDSGAFLPVYHEHLRVSSTKVAKSVHYRVAQSDLDNFFEPSRTGSDDLIHKATRDLWALKKDGDSYVIERLFDEAGDPLKV